MPAHLQQQHRHHQQRSAPPAQWQQQSSMQPPAMPRQRKCASTATWRSAPSRFSPPPRCLASTPSPCLPPAPSPALVFDAKRSLALLSAPPPAPHPPSTSSPRRASTAVHVAAGLGLPGWERLQRVLSICFAASIYIFPTAAPLVYLRWRPWALAAYRVAFFAFALLRRARSRFCRQRLPMPCHQPSPCCSQSVVCSTCCRTALAEPWKTAA